MGRHPTKAAGNPWCDARLKAAKYDDRLYSRQFAAELLGISHSQLADYELNKTKVVPVDSAIRMADLYNAPELKNYYCRKICPLGCEFPEIRDEGFLMPTIRALSVFEKMEWIRVTLTEIAKDGKITDDEWDDFNRILELLEEIETVSQQLKNHACKVKGGKCDAGNSKAEEK